MFRSLFRRTRTVRVPVENSGHKVQEVRVFRGPFSKPSNFITTFFIAYFAFRLLETYTLPKDKGQGKEKFEEWKKQSGLNEAETSLAAQTEHWKKQHEALAKAHGLERPGPFTLPDLSTFPGSPIATIAIPLWIRERQRRLYTPSDQEVKDYIRVQSDPKKIAQLKRQVGDWAIARLKNPVHEVNLNHIGFLGQVTVVLDLVPQVHAPPLYEIPAFIVFKDGVGFGWKILRPDLGTKMDSVFRPSVTYQAAKASFKAFFWTSYIIAKAKVTGGPAPQIKTSAKQLPSSVVSQKDLERDNAIPPASSWSSITNTQSMQELLRAVHTGDNARERHSDLLKSLPFSVAVQYSAAVFRRTQLMGLAYEKQRTTPGVMQIRGVIVCQGERGKYRMDVLAYYVPGEDRFLGPLTVSNAYVVMDYGRLLPELEKKKAERKERVQRAHARAKESSDVAAAWEKEFTTKEVERTYEDRIRASSDRFKEIKKILEERKQDREQAGKATKDESESVSKSTASEADGNRQPPSTTCGKGEEKK